jgi:hypothetical protein
VFWFSIESSLIRSPLAPSVRYTFPELSALALTCAAPIPPPKARVAVATPKMPGAVSLISSAP